MIPSRPATAATTLGARSPGRAQAAPEPLALGAQLRGPSGAPRALDLRNVPALLLSEEGSASACDPGRETEDAEALRLLLEPPLRVLPAFDDSASAGSAIVSATTLEGGGAFRLVFQSLDLCRSAERLFDGLAICGERLSVSRGL